MLVQIVLLSSFPGPPAVQPLAAVCFLRADF